eukprot:Platyproteum_vivax@DN11388_c0_g1_i1.p1
MAAPQPESVSFNTLKADVDKVIKQCVDYHLGSASYNPKDVQNWVDRLSNDVIERLQDMNDSFKYIVSVAILQKNGAGYHTSVSCYWETATDGAVTYKWENNSMHCII